MALLMAGMLMLNAATVSDEELQAFAEQAGVDATELAGAVATTGMDPYNYLVATGHINPPRTVTTYSVWDRLADCESDGRWNIDAYHDGGLQFHPTTWTNYKPAGYPRYAYQASREQQILVAERVLKVEGWEAWPACSRRLKLR